MANDIGSVKGVTGCSVALNGQSGQGGQKPAPSGSRDPGGTRPSKPAEPPVAMPK